MDKAIEIALGLILAFVAMAGIAKLVSVILGAN